MDHQGRTSFALVAALLDCEPKREVVEKRAKTLYGQLKAKTRQGSGHSLDGPDTVPAAVCILLAQETSVLPQTLCISARLMPVFPRLSTALDEKAYQRVSGVPLRAFRTTLKKARSLLTAEEKTPTRQLRSGATSSPVPSTSKRTTSAIKRSAPSSAKSSPTKKARFDPPASGSKDAAVDTLVISAKAKGKAKELEPSPSTGRATRSSGPAEEAQITPTKAKKATPKKSTPKKATPKAKAKEVTPEVEQPEEEPDEEWKKEEPRRESYRAVYDFELGGEARWKMKEKVEEMLGWWDGIRGEVEGLVQDQRPIQPV